MKQIFTGRKIITIMLLIILAAATTGCVSSANRMRILSELKQNGIIDQDWEQIDEFSYSAAPIPGISHYEYGYQDSDGEYYSLYMDGGFITETDENGKERQYCYVSLSDKQEVTESEEAEYHENGEVTYQKVNVYHSTDETTTTGYKVYYTEILWMDIWEVEEAE